MTLDEALGALFRLDCNPRKTGECQWQARCPVHDDRNPSLAVSVARDGAPLLHCHAGCLFEDVIAALDTGRTVLDAAPSQPPTPDPLPTDAELRAYQDALTEPVAAAVQKVRGWSLATLRAHGIGYANKHLQIPMYERAQIVNVGRYQPGRGKVKGLKHRTKPLYHLPHLGAVAGDRPLWIVEGEPDVLSAYELCLWAIGVPGVNNWRQEYAARFKGRAVRICIDCDDQGREAAERILADLIPVTDRVRVIDLDATRLDGYDLTDVLLEARAADGLLDARRLLRWIEGR